MSRPRIWCLVLLTASAVAALDSPARSSSATNGNCDCYYSSDCANPQKQYCNYQSACTRHCVPAADPDDPNNDGATAECDGDPELDGPGHCVDNEPTPPNGTDGDGDQCAKNDPTDTTTYKIRDGSCTWRPKREQTPGQLETMSGGIHGWIIDLANLIDNGGGHPRPLSDFLGAHEVGGRRALRELEDVVMIVTTFSLGQAFTQPNDVAPQGVVVLNEADFVCGRELVLAAGEGFVDEILAPGSNAVYDRLSLLSDECRAFANSRTTNCLYPHPPSHGHEYPFVDAIDCIATELEAVARSLTTPSHPANTPGGNH